MDNFCVSKYLFFLIYLGGTSRPLRWWCHWAIPIESWDIMSSIPGVFGKPKLTALAFQVAFWLTGCQTNRARSSATATIAMATCREQNAPCKTVRSTAKRTSGRGIHHYWVLWDTLLALPSRARLASHTRARGNSHIRVHHLPYCLYINQ